MKIAVSIPDPVFKAAERLAKRLGVSRSELYARAIDEFNRNHAGRPKRRDIPADPEVVKQINESLALAGPNSSELDDAWKAARNRALDKEDW